MTLPSEMTNRGRTRRHGRYVEFRIFVPLATDWFPEIASRDPRHEFLSKTYGFYVVPGGREGAVDKRVLEVFYGQRPIDQVTEVSRESNPVVGLPIAHTRFVTEIGATLRYQRTDHGTVLCLLEPARSEGSSRPESLVVLAHIREPRCLTGKPILERHWRALLSYFECGSVDGDPHLTDRLRMWWLLFSRPLIIDGKVQGRRIFRVGGEILKWAITIGLSGALLEVVRLVAKATGGGPQCVSSIVGS